MVSWAPYIAAGSQALGAVTSALGARKVLSGSDAAGRQFDDNWTMYKRQMHRGPSMEMAGLKAAGINPLLRYGQHGSPLPVTAHGVSMAPPYNPWQSVGQGIAEVGSSAVDAMRTEAETDRTVQATRNLAADLEKTIAQIDNINANTALTQVDRDKRLEEVQLTWAKTLTEWMQQSAIQKQMQLTDAQIEKITHEIPNIDANTLAQRMAALYSQTRSELLALGIPAARVDAEVAQTFPAEVGRLFRGIFLGDIGKTAPRF